MELEVNSSVLVIPFDFDPQTRGSAVLESRDMAELIDWQGKQTGIANGLHLGRF